MITQIKQSEYVDPESKIILNIDINGNLTCKKDGVDIRYDNNNGTYNFVSRDEVVGETDHYNNVYSQKFKKKLTPDDISKPWDDFLSPENKIILESMGNIRKKRILLLGNGVSSKELYFLNLGADVIYTDISIEAVLFMRDIYSKSAINDEEAGNIEFHAVDAIQLPFLDNSFDVIYGYAFVHHLEDLDPFLLEVKRCLKKGGICRFLDDAYSPVWHKVKEGALKPLQLYTHRKSGISPADLRATFKGGFQKKELVNIMNKYDFGNMIFKRSSFLYYFWDRGITKLFKNYIHRFKVISLLIIAIDNLLISNYSFFQRNQIKLVWGFDMDIPISKKSITH